MFIVSRVYLLIAKREIHQNHQRVGVGEVLDIFSEVIEECQESVVSDARVTV